MTRSNNLSALQLASITVAVLLQCTSSFSFTTTPLLKTRVPRLKLRGDVPAVTSPTASKNGMSMLLNYDQSYSMKSRQKIGRIEVESTHLDFKTQTLITDSTDEQQPHIVAQQQIRDRFPNEQKEKTRQLDQELHDHIGDVDQAFTSAKAIYKELTYGEARDTMTQEEKDAKLMLAMKLMDQVFESDFAQVRNKQYAGVTDLRAVTNVTCMRPKNVDQQVEACLFDDDLLKMDLEEGRVCAGGCCSEAGSRVKLSNVISEAECNEMISLSDSLMFDNADSFAGQKQNLPLQLSAAAADIDFHLLYLRLIERMRRTVAHEYGLPLDSVSPRQTFVSRIVSTEAKDLYKILHVDECSTPAYHYSCVLYLSDRNSFTGGEFVFCDPNSNGARPKEEVGVEQLSEKGSGWDLKPFSPEQGNAMMFSSGWENYHYVEEVHSGSRYAVPIFFTTENVEMEHAFADGDALSRARALYDMGIAPTTYEGFLHFKAQWARFFAPI